MKLIAKYLKPFTALLLVCLVLLFGQALCDLSLPNLMSDIVNVGIQQGGVEVGAPDAMNQQAMALLSPFFTPEEQKLVEEQYITVQPQSSEAARLEEKYPLMKEQALSVKKTGLSEETEEALTKAYGKASYALMLFLQQQGDALAAYGQQAPQGGSSAMPEAPGEEGASSGLEEGLSMGESSETTQSASAQSQGMSQTAQGSGEALRVQPLFAGEPSSAVAGETTPPAGETTSPAGDPAQEPKADELDSGTADTKSASSIDITKLYPLAPVLSQIPGDGIQAAREQAHSEAATMMGDQVGITFKRMFYDELGLDMDALRNDYIWMTGFKMLGVVFLGVLATVLVGLFSARIAAKVAKRMRHDLFAKVESFSNGEFDKFSTASLITRTTNDVQQVQMLITMGIRMVCYAPIMGIGGVIFAVGKSVSMSWIIVAAVVALIGLIVIAMSLAMPRFKILQKLIDKLNLVSRENLSGMMVVRAFGNESYEEKRFDGANKELAETNRYVQRVMSMMMPFMMLIMNITSVVVVWVGGHAIAESTLQIGDMMAFIQYTMQIIMSFLMIAMMFIMVPRASVSAVRIAEVLNTPLLIQDNSAPETLKDAKGKVEFKDVSFRYLNAESDVLEHISFVATPGQTTAFIGATGSGKSTLINLIPRFYDVTAGSVEVDGVDIRKLSQAELRQNIGYVPQKGMLFSGTVESNLRYGKENADQTQLAEAIAVAQSTDFVAEMDNGIQSDIAQGGTNVSGGQRQRLSIARALVRKAPIVIFDDSFSALDFKTDAALRRALHQYTHDATVLIVAQRVSTIMHAQQIIVLDDGKMVGKGTHKELLQNCPEYREIAESQLQKEELE